MTHEDVPECLDDHGEADCEGPVEFHSIDPGRERAWPRCEKHWEVRLDRWQNSIERYATSDVPPPWFDPANAGEEW